MSSIQFLDFVSGTLKMYVSSQGKMIPAGQEVNVYRVQEGKDLYVMVCAHSGFEPVKLPYYGTDVEMLLKEGSVK